MVTRTTVAGVGPQIYAPGAYSWFHAGAGAITTKTFNACGAFVSTCSTIEFTGKKIYAKSVAFGGSRPGANTLAFFTDAPELASLTARATIQCVGI